MHQIQLHADHAHRIYQQIQAYYDNDSVTVKKIQQELTNVNAAFQKWLDMSDDQLQDEYGAVGFFIITPAINGLYNILWYSLPPLGVNHFSTRGSTGRKQSVYNFNYQKSSAPFGRLDNFTSQNMKQYKSTVWMKFYQRAKLHDNARADYGNESDIHVKCLEILQNIVLMDKSFKNVDVSNEYILLVAQFCKEKVNRVDLTCFQGEEKSIFCICEVKKPGFDMDNVTQIVDYMVDLRNQYSVKHPFVILTTYEQWRFLWFKDSDGLAAETSIDGFISLAAKMSATDKVVEGPNVDISLSEVYSFDDPNIGPILLSLLFKARSSVNTAPTDWNDQRKAYLLSEDGALKFKSLGYNIKTKQSKFSFSYEFPTLQEMKNYFVLYFCGGSGDGRVALACSQTGKLCVLKIFHEIHNEAYLIEHEKQNWKLINNVDCYSVMLHTRRVLVMPFCFCLRLSDKVPRLVGLTMWGSRTISSYEDDGKTGSVSDFEKLNFELMAGYQAEPLKLAEEAIGNMARAGYCHDDLEWRHVALLPVFDPLTDKFVLNPCLIDLTRVSSHNLGSYEQQLFIDSQVGKLKSQLTLKRKVAE